MSATAEAEKVRTDLRRMRYKPLDKFGMDKTMPQRAGLVDGCILWQTRNEGAGWRTGYFLSYFDCTSL
jgi:hypothetical protein